MSRRQTPQISASAVHEVRMILQQILRHRSSMAFWSPKPVKPVFTLLCARCMIENLHIPSKAAVTVVNGMAVCHGHAAIALGKDMMSNGNLI